MNIEIHQLNKIYRGGVHALNDVDMSIPSGMFGLLGPNGAGKTTLMRILAGILKPTSGLLFVDGYDGNTDAGRTAIKRMLGYLPQDLGVYPDLTAYEFLDYVAILKGMNDRAARGRRVSELLETVELMHVAKRRLKAFSGGMKRRVGIAQALLNDPHVLIVDEPTAGLDPEERIRFRNLLSELGGDRTVLLSTHIVEDIAQTCRNVAIMKQGRALFQGTTAALVDEAKGKVWTLTTAGERPRGDFTIVSTINLGALVQYRVVGDLSPRAGAALAQPTLEDAYIWLMREQRAPMPMKVAV